jgi:hypothetical protein
VTVIEDPIRRRALIVLGMHRSGTSAMARVLSLVGADLPLNIMPAHESNSAGHWEPQAVAEFNDVVLGELDSHWDDTFGPRRNDKKPLAIERFVQRAGEILRAEYPSSDLAVFKDPRVSILLELWRKAFENEAMATNFVIMVRRPDEVARSLNDRGPVGTRKALLLWASYMSTAELATRGYPRVFVTFDALLNRAEDELDRIEAALDLTFPRRTWNSAMEVEEFLQPALRHHSATAALRLPSELRPIADLYAYLEAAADDRPKNDDVPGEVAAWLQGLDRAVGPILKATERERDAAKAKAADVEGRLGRELAQVRGETQALREHAGALGADRDAALARAAELEHQLVQVRGEAQALREHADVLGADRDAALARVAEIEHELAQAGEEARALRQQAEALCAARDGAQATAADTEQRLGEQLDQARAEVQALREQADALSADRDAAQARAVELERQLAQAGGEAQVLRVQAVALGAARDAAYARVADVERQLGEQLAQARAETQAAHEKAESLRAALAAAETAAVDIERQLIQTRVADVERRLETGAKIRALSEEIAECGRLLDAARAAAEDTRREVEAELSRVREAARAEVEQAAAIAETARAQADAAIEAHRAELEAVHADGEARAEALAQAARAEAEALVERMRAQADADAQCARSESERLQAEATAAQEAVRARDLQIETARCAVDARDLHLQAMYNSTSWRLLRPIRAPLRLLRGEITLDEVGRRVTRALFGARPSDRR